MTERKNFPIEWTAFHLRLLALLCMLLDHMWAIVVPGSMWMTCVGRIAFPIFAFQLVEGYFHTSDLKRYKQRMLLFALLSEIPFNLIVGGSVFYPFHQNVMWTLLLGLMAMERMDKVRQRSGNRWVMAARWALWVLLFYVVALLLMVDHFGYGILMILAFYFFRGTRWSALLQLAAMVGINCYMMEGMTIPLLGGMEVPVQGFAVLAMIPICLYRGQQGYRSRWWSRFSYWFYPLHALALYLVWTVL